MPTSSATPPDASLHSPHKDHDKSMRTGRISGLGILGALLLGSAALAADELTDAVKARDHDKGAALIAAHVNVNEASPDQSRALSWAVDCQDEATVRLL